MKMRKRRKLVKLRRQSPWMLVYSKTLEAFPGFSYGHDVYEYTKPRKVVR